MSTNVIQPAFSGGELSPSLYARVDLEKYHSGAALMRNFFVDYRGGASTRMGTAVVGQAQDSENFVRVIPFQFSTLQNYALEFGNLYMRVIKEGAYITEAVKYIVSISQASTAVVGSTTHGFSNGDQLFLSGIAGMTELNGRTVVATNVTTDSFEILNLNGTPVDSTGYTTYTTNGTAARLYSIVTPYISSDLRLLKFTQSADVMTITHPSYSQRNLSRSAEASWALSVITIGSTMTAPGAITPAASTTGKTSYAYVVTAVGTDGQESVASPRASQTLAVDIGSVAGNIKLTWAAVTGADHYNIYKANPVTGDATAIAVPLGVNYGYIGNTSTPAFTDSNIIPDFTRSPPVNNNPFAATGDKPGVVAYFQQRRIYAASTNEPETFWCSQPKFFNNFDKAIPTKDDDSIEATLASRQVNAIKYMIPMPGGLVMLTTGGAWQVSGGSFNEPITPSQIVAVPQAYNGCTDVEPLPINYNILYVQQRGSIVRDLSYNFYTNIYTGSDISIFSNHFFFGYEILDWCYAEEPFKVIWAVRDDGQMLSLTYLSEQKIIGWALHSTKGVVESCCSIQEGNENVVYLVVRRTIEGENFRFIERMADRHFPYGVEDAWCVDCGLQNTLTYPAAGLVASTSTGAVTFTADAPIFSASDIGKVLRVGGGIANITAYTSPTVITGTLIQNISVVIPEDPALTPQPADSGDWSLTTPITVVTGLDHLEGEAVACLADGNVVSGLTVLDGAVTLPVAASKITIGLAFTPRLQTLYLDTGEPTIQGKRKNIAALTVRVQETRGLKMGSTFETLHEFKQRKYEAMGRPIDLFTGDQRIVMDTSWTEPGQMCIEQSYPLPATVLGVIPELVIGDSK